MKHRKLAALLLAVCMVLTVAPSFTAAEATDAADTLTRGSTGVTGNSYSSWTYTSADTKVTYVGNSAGGNESIQLRSKSNSGIVTTASGGKVTKIKPTWNSDTDPSRVLVVYGKTTAYSSPADLYGSNAGTQIGTIAYNDKSAELTITGDYAYIGLRSNDGALYLTEIEITWLVDNGTPTAYTVSFDPNGGTGTMEKVVATTKDYQLPECGFTAPEGMVFDYWAVDGDEGRYAPGDPYTLTGDTTFVAQWKECYTYNKISDAAQLTNGRYLLVAEENNLLFNGVSADSGNYSSVTISNDAIVGNYASSEIIIAAMDGNGNYSLKNSNDKYLYGLSGSNTIGFGNKTANTITFNNGLASIASNGKVLQLNSTNTPQFFRYYKDTASYTKITLFKKDIGSIPQYTVTLKAGEGTGNDITESVPEGESYELPQCGFTAPEGKVFDYWAVDGAEGMYAPGDPYTLTGDTTFVAQWKDAPVYTYMTRLSDLRNGDKVVIFYPDSSKVVTGTDYYFNNTKHELASADATVTDGILAAPKEALVLTVAKKTGEDGITRYTFKTADNKYLEADETHVRLVDAEGANTLFQLETASADTNSYYIKCDSATDGNSEAQYLEYYKGYFTVFGMGTTTKYYTFQFYAEPAPRIHSHSLTLDGEIGLNFKMELPELDGVDYTNSYMTFAIPHGSCTERVNYSESAAKSTEVRGFACYVNAIQMAEPITATFHYTQNGTEKTVEETYSVEDYFITFDAIKDDFSEATVALTHALADYGYFAQRFLSEQRGWELGKDYAEMKKVYQTSYDVETVQGAVAADAVDRKLNDNVEKISYSLVLDSATEIRVFFKPVSGYDGTFTVNAPYTVKKVGANYQVSVMNIPAHELSKKYTIVMTTEAGTAEITASVMSYVNSMLEYFTNDAAAQYAAAAIYYYAQAANTYLTPPAN